MKREFYLRSDQSNKFWTVEVDGCDVVSANGRIGAKPRETRHSYADPAAAQAQADKDVAAKLKKGYVEGALDALPAYAPPDWANLPMNEDTFWRVIALFNWKHTGDDDAVLAPATKALAQMPFASIAEFHRILSRKLYDLDTEARALRDIFGNFRRIIEHTADESRHELAGIMALEPRRCIGNKGIGGGVGFVERIGRE